MKRALPFHELDPNPTKRPKFSSAFVASIPIKSNLHRPKEHLLEPKQHYNFIASTPTRPRKCRPRLQSSSIGRENKPLEVLESPMVTEMSTFETISLDKPLHLCLQDLILDKTKRLFPELIYKAQIVEEKVALVDELTSFFHLAFRLRLSFPVDVWILLLRLSFDATPKTITKEMVHHIHIELLKGRPSRHLRFMSGYFATCCLFAALNNYRWKDLNLIFLPPQSLAELQRFRKWVEHVHLSEEFIFGILQDNILKVSGRKPVFIQ